MNDPTAWLNKKLHRLAFLAELFETAGFTAISYEIKSLQTKTEVQAFYDALKKWIF